MSTTTKKQPRALYGGKRPADYLPAHNHVMHTPEFPHGMNGFRRFWIPPEWTLPGKGWLKCPCGWRGHDPNWQTHYALAEHVKSWKSEIKKRGSLEKVHQFILRRLAKMEKQHAADYAKATARTNKPVKAKKRKAKS